MSKWHKGPPPSVGWWPASTARQPKCVRWWNGKAWSLPAYEGFSKKDVKDAAAIESFHKLSAIQWQHRPASWPKRSRT